ncbi:Fc.00g052290.m01.CDS01 [Cosmosporella sp. VM-42]
MKLSAAFFVLASGVVASPRSLLSLEKRTDYCGMDQYGGQWYCAEDNTECCVGSVQGICMPSGYTCCDTGYFCDPNEECWISNDTGVQYCVPVGGSDADATRTAETHSAGQTSSSGDTSKDKDKDDDDDNAALALSVPVIWALMPILGAMIVWF